MFYAPLTPFSGNLVCSALHVAWRNVPQKSCQQESVFLAETMLKQRRVTLCLTHIKLFGHERIAEKTSGVLLLHKTKSS